MTRLIVWLVKELTNGQFILLLFAIWLAVLYGLASTLLGLVALLR